MRQKRRIELKSERKRNSRIEQRKKGEVSERNKDGDYNADCKFTEEFLQRTQIRRLVEFSTT